MKKTKFISSISKNFLTCKERKKDRFMFPGKTKESILTPC